MTERAYRVLFLSRRNSARSVMAEAVLNKVGRGRFQAFSAAVEPAEAIDPHVVELLASSEYPLAETRPRHYREFVEAGAADLDFVFTLSDTAAGEPLPTWPGLPVTAHWSSPDPILAAQAEGAEWERRQVFVRTLGEFERRLRTFANLKLAALDRLTIQHQIDEIGRTTPHVPT